MRGWRYWLFVATYGKVKDKPSVGWLPMRDTAGHLVFIPGDLRDEALAAEVANEAANQETMGEYQFGPYTAGQIRAIWWAFRDVDDPDLAVLTIVAHTDWEQDR